MNESTSALPAKPSRPRKPKAPKPVTAPDKLEALSMPDKNPPSERMAFSFWGIRAEAQGHHAIKVIFRIILIAMGCGLVAVFSVKLL